MVWLKDSAIYSNLSPLVVSWSATFSHLVIEVSSVSSQSFAPSYLNLGPLVIEVSWSGDRKPGWGFYSEEQKRACPRMPNHSCARERASDLVKLQRELEIPSLNSPNTHYTISQTVSSSLIHLIQQLDVKPHN